jgi:argininosuccinate synthase
VSVELRPGRIFVTGVASPHSLMAASRGKYGESAGEWSSEDAVGFSRILAIPGILHARAGQSANEES